LEINFKSTSLAKISQTRATNFAAIACHNRAVAVRFWYTMRLGRRRLPATGLLAPFLDLSLNTRRLADPNRLSSPRCRGNRLIGALVAVAIALTFPIAVPAYDLHYDYTSFGSTFGQSQLDVLNYPSINGNYMMTSGDTHRPEMVANGNNLAEFYNWLEQRYEAHTTKDGNLSADEIDAYVVSNSMNNGPKPTWLILNEISSSLWSANPGSPSISTYRTWLIDCVTRLHGHYGYQVVSLAPFQNPGANDASWQALQQVSYVGIECYLSGTEVWNSGSTTSQRLSWAQSQYQASKNSYISRGVPASRLFVTEHFANNNAVDDNGNAVGWGRAGLASAADWDSVLQTRQDAIYNVGFAGFLAYNWGGNGMGITQAEQIQHEYYYRSRLALPGQKPQWLSDSAIDVNGSTIPLSWSQPLNWIGGVPNAAGGEANFWRTITANRTITLDGSKTVGKLSFDESSSYTISPGTGGSLIFNNSGSAATLTSTQGSHTISTPITLTSSVSATINTGIFAISGAISGAGGITKSGAGTLSLTATNSYTGNTTVQAGKLSLTNRGLADAADVSLSSGSTLDLQFSGSADAIDSLFINGISQPAGTWGATGSGAQFTSSLLSGSGWLQIATYVPSFLTGDYNSNGVVDAADYIIWRRLVGTTSIPNRDPDNNGPVGQADFNSWRSHLGQIVGAGAGSGSSLEGSIVPEPATLGLFIIMLLITSLGRRNRACSATCDVEIAC
jgi:autotransporter-associated beta strand protein